MRIRRRQSHRQNHLHDVPLTPLIDVALTLLVIFIIAAPAIQHSIKISLPHGSSQEASPAESHDITVYIDSSENIYLNDVLTSKSELIESIKKSTVNEQKAVYFKADRDGVKYGTVIELVDEIKGIGGVKYVALATQKRSQHISSLV